MISAYRTTSTRKSVEDWKVNLTDAYEPFADSLAELDYDTTRPYTLFHFWGCAGAIKESEKLSERMVEAYLKKVRIFRLHRNRR